MSIRSEVENRTMTLLVGGEIDHHQVKSLMPEVERRIDLHLPNTLIVDLSGVTFMDSSGVALLLRAWRRMQELEGRMNVTQVPPQAARILRAAGLEQMMQIEPQKGARDESL
ncbi:MAG: STAS domain-containing protein [Oscillospiraceae bacterium]|nr:STAS domain-containing protein [Oscillospiraceae bacterium]